MFKEHLETSWTEALTILVAMGVITFLFLQ